MTPWTAAHQASLPFTNSLCAVLSHSACPTLCNPMDCSPPDSSVYGDSQARILEWVVMPSFRGSSEARDRTQVSHIAGGLLTSWVIREAQEYWSGYSLSLLQGIFPTQESNLVSRISGRRFGVWATRERFFYPSNLTHALLRSLALQALAHSPCLAYTFLLRCLLSVHMPISVFVNFVSLGLGSHSIGVQ